MAVIELSAPWEVPFEEEEEDEEEREMEVFMVAGKRCEGKEPGELAFSEGPYETSVDQEKQDGSRSHKDRLADTEVPLTLNVDKAGHLGLENVNDLQDVLLLGKRRDRRAPVRKAPPPPEAVPYYVDENDFLKACEENKMSLVERYLTRGGDPDACDTFRRTALHKACSRGHVAVTETLLEAGAAIESKDKLEATAVHCACRGGSLPALELLLNRGANFSTRDKLRSTPLHVAVRTGHYDCAQHLVHCGAEVNAKDRVAGKRCEGKEPGELAFSEGPYETSVDQEKQDGSRSHKDRLADTEVPLTLNVDKAGHLGLENVNDLQNVLLLGKRRDRRAPVRKAPPPPEAVPYYVDENDFLKACEENKMSLVERYLTRGGDPDACDTFRRTALHKACSRGHVAVTETLLEAGAAIESKDKLEATAVHCACRGGSLPALELLLNRGANFSTRDKLRSTPLHVAVRTGHYDCAQHLVHCGAEVNAKDRDGDTPMHDAVRLNRPKIIQLLLLHGANLKLKNCEGKSPMDSTLEWQSGAKNMLSTFKQDGQSQNK